MASLHVSPSSNHGDGKGVEEQPNGESLSSKPATAAPAPAQEESSIHKLARIIPRSKDLPWYQASYGSRLTAQTHDLLKNNAKIPPQDISSHIYQIVRLLPTPLFHRNKIILTTPPSPQRDQAWAIFPFPCIGEFWFLTLGLSAHPRYPDLLNRLTSAPNKSQPLLIDLGTCLGQDLRKLVHDGASPTQLLGIDIFPAFESVGHALFRDKDTFTTGRFAAADIFSSSHSGVLAETRGTWAIVSSCMFLHSFDWAGQLAACIAMVQLAIIDKNKKSQPKSWIIGCLTASLHAREQELKPPFVPEGVKRSVFLQSRESFARLWDEVRDAMTGTGAGAGVGMETGMGAGVDVGTGKGTGVEFNVWAEYDEGESESKKAHEGGAGNFFGGEGQKLLWFWVEVG